MERKRALAVFQVLSRRAQLAAPPRKHTRLLPYQQYIIARVLGALLLASLIIGLLATVSHDIVFFLIPVLLSISTAQPQHYNLNKLLSGAPVYLLLTICLTFIYFSIVIGGELFTHQSPTYSHLALVTTALAWAILWDPIRTYVQSLIERRFNVRDREAIKVIEAFTATLREEIDLDQLRDRFLTVIQRTMQPYSVSLWTRISHEQQEKSSSQEEIMIADDDPLLAYMLSHPGTREIDRLQLDSPVLQDMKLHAAEMILPLANQGELLGLLILGPHLKGDAYTREELTMLNTLAPQVAPALRVAQMVQAQQAQVREHERIEQELRTAQDIQHTFLPKDVPDIPGWQLVPYYQSAREVGGDFYDFLPFEDGRLGLVIGDVAGKGIPAALVMTATRTMLRTAAQETASPGWVCARVNELLYAEIPSKMFVTCFYAMLDPTSGLMRFANAGHDLPYLHHVGGVSELRATGMPLGLMSGSFYDEHEVTIAPGESLLFYTDGLVEAHNPGREMFGFPRLKTLLEEYSNGTSLFKLLLSELKSFTGEEWEQEDDITMVTLQRTSL
jgi:serine phosphatase RsbU (regulator of sigma subunit)